MSIRNYAIYSIILLIKINQAFTSKTQNVSNSTSNNMAKRHPFLDNITLSKEMLDLLGISEREKRQYFLFKNPSNNLSSEITLPPTPLIDILEQMDRLVKSLPTETESPVKRNTDVSDIDRLINVAAQSALPAEDESAKTGLDQNVNLPSLDIIRLLENYSTPATTIDIPYLKTVTVNDKTTNTVHHFTRASTEFFQNVNNTQNSLLEAVSNIAEIKNITATTNSTVISKQAVTTFNPSSRLATIIAELMSRTTPASILPVIDNMIKPKNPQFNLDNKRRELSIKDLSCSSNANEGGNLGGNSSGTTSGLPSVAMCVSIPPTTPGTFGETKTLPETTTGSCEPFGKQENLVDALVLIKSGIEDMILEKNFGQREGLPCDIIGNWTSDTAGVNFEISKGECVAKVVLHDAINKTCGSSFMNSMWKPNLVIPYPKTGLIVLTATYEEQLQIAAFSGECRICEGKEFITGHWLLVTSESDCTDLNKAQISFGDIWRRATKL